MADEQTPDEATEETPAGAAPDEAAAPAESAEPAGEGHAVPTADAQEIAGSAEDAPLEALQEAEDAEAETIAESEEDLDDDVEEAPREKPAVPGAHLEVDIVLEGTDPLGAGGEEYVDPYALDEDGEQTSEAG